MSKEQTMTRIGSVGGNRTVQALGIAAVLLGLLGLGGTRAAAQGTIIERSTTINALANGTFCTVGGDGAEACTELSLHVSPDKFGETLIACLALTTTAGDVVTNEEGCADVAATFAMDTEELAWAALATTPVDLYVSVCSGKECDFVYSRTVALGADWTATGELTRVQQTVGNPHGPCTVTDKIDGLVRDAAVVVTVDGALLEASGNLQVLDSKTARRTNCG
jgi:hypothetical protein